MSNIVQLTNTEVERSAQEISDGLSQELGNILASRVRQEEREIVEEQEEKVQQYAMAGGFAENFILLAVFSLPIAFLFYMLAKSSILPYMEKEVFPKFDPDYVPKEEPKAAEKSEPGMFDGVDWQNVFEKGAIIFGIVATLALIGATIFYIRKRSLKKYTITQSEYETRRKALAEVTRDLVADDAQEAALSTLNDLYAIHEHLQEKPESMRAQAKELTNVYGRVVLAGRMVDEIDDYQTTRETVHAIGSDNKKYGAAQSELDQTLVSERQELLGHVQEIAESVSLLRGEMLQIESVGARRKELKSASQETVSHVQKMSADLNDKMTSVQQKLSQA